MIVLGDQKSVLERSYPNNPSGKADNIQNAKVFSNPEEYSLLMPLAFQGIPQKDLRI